ncbi:UTP--glucose-1-phosphate uridylyltransferase [Roseburia intestinalis L1-82]|uniref:UTP--glucose-1-phosphate uridylyltransferase n=2 Tax=Roseburia intestinalis L1-82 TaxID=536231 RepID=C7GFB8_9FIRM|nr:UTP--glucose-1-phosphate uridylyltransferase [Roseburia intestinalis L1-82]
MEKRMKIWEDDNQKYIKAMMEKNTTEQNEKLTKRLEEIDFSVLEHIERKETVNERGVFAPLDAVEVSEIEARGAEFKELGLKAIREGKVGAVLLAGGQGTRLGLDRPKGTLNIGVAKELYLFEQLLRNLMDVTDEAGVYVPLYIMTSNINNADTTAFFEEHDYFGYPKDYVKFFVQEMVPACDYEGRIYMESQTEVAMSPNGNGGWFSSMVNAGLLSDIKERGIEWINVFAVDNCLQRIADPMFVGATIAYGCESGAKVVRKAAPDERVGVLCTEDGKPSIAEYYEMTEEMSTARKENGDLKYGFGVILNYLFSEKKLEQIADARMPIHVVEKKIPYMDVDGTFVKPEQPNGYKFETLVLDMVHMMDDCIPYEVVREREFAPIKNLHGVDSLDSARELMKGCGIEL